MLIEDYYFQELEEPERLELILGATMNLLMAGVPEAAVEALKSAEATSPDNPRLHLMLGLAYRDANHPDKAENHLRQAIQLDPYHEHGIWAREALGLLLIDQDKDREGADMLIEAGFLAFRDLELYPDLGLILGYADTLTAVGEVEKASELLSLHWEELERIDWSTLDEPGTSPAEIGRFYAEVLTALGHLEEAEEVKLAIAAQEAEDPEAVLVWAKSLSKSNRLHHARELLERIVKGDPSNVDARRLLADALQAEAHWLQQESE